MNTHNRINYIEFQADDLKKIKAFYTKAFGWKFTDYGPDYAAFSDGALDGGFAKGVKRGKSVPLVILYSDNLEASVETVKECGGTITKSIYSFPGGRRFHFVDPSGNELAVWSASATSHA